jgi:hypothetical protein
VSGDATFTAGTAITAATFALRKNGTLIAQSAPALLVGAGATVTAAPASATAFMQSDGNDTIDMYVTVSGTGALAGNFQVSILAV